MNNATKKRTLTRHLGVKRVKTLGLSLAMGLITGCTTQGIVSDAQVDAKHSGYERQQGAIKTLNDSGQHRVASYSLAKSQCWLDVSYHEFSRNDRSAFVPQALVQSQRITDYLSAGNAPDGLDNPAHQTLLVNDAAQLRQDLWDLAANLKQQPGFSCATQQVACAEVELVHAGNEYNQQGWRHAKPYVQIAEDLIGAAEHASDNCTAAPTVATSKKAPKAGKPISMQVNVLFNFDKYTLDEALPSSIAQLENIVERVNTGNYTVSKLNLTGHADRSNNTGDPNYNLLLSQRRAKTVLSYLETNGIDVSNTPVVHKGATVQVNTCEDKSASRAEYIKCLLPNRRVVVRLNLTPK